MALRAACSAIQRGIAVEQLEAPVGAQRLEAGLHRAVTPRDDLRSEPDAGAVVGREQPLGVEHGDPPASLAVAGRRLGDLGSRGAGALVELAQHLGLALGRD